MPLTRYVPSCRSLLEAYKERLATEKQPASQPAHGCNKSSTFVHLPKVTPSRPSNPSETGKSTYPTRAKFANRLGAYRQ